MTETIEKINREAFESLLPWYVSGRLGDTENQQVQEFLRENPEFLNQIDLVKEEQDTVVKTNEALGAPSSQALERLMQGIEAEKRQSGSLLLQFNTWFGAILGGFGGLRPLAMAAAIAVIVIQAGVIGMMVSGQSGKGWKTAFFPGEKRKGSYVFVKFSDRVSVNEMKQLLEDFNANVVAGPEVNGMFRIRVSEKRLSEEELQKVVSALAGKPEIVKRVFPAD